MSAIADAAQALETALAAVPDWRVYRDPTAVVEPPAAVVAPPTVTWDMLDPDPSRATFEVWVIVAMDSRAVERLWDMLPQASAAIATNDRATITGPARPGTWSSGGTDLPGYTISVEVAL